MADAYEPALDEFAFADGEQAAVDGALATDDPWGWDPGDEVQAAALKAAKKRILDFHLQRHNYHCCYCRKSLHGEGPFITDREHVLPKGSKAFRQFSYEIWNLAASCKRCNMQFKGRGTRFLVDAANAALFQSSDNYRFVHPNFDCFEDHVKRKVEQNGIATVVAYTSTGSEKAEYTIDFFKLRDLERDSFDAAQGRSVPEEDSAIAVQVRELARQFSQ